VDSQVKAIVSTASALLNGVEVMTKPRLNARLTILVLLVVFIAALPAASVAAWAQANRNRPKKAGGVEASKITIDTLNVKDGEKVEAIITNLMHDHGIPGMEVAIQKKGKTVFEAGYGSISKEKKEQKIPGPNTRFQIDSLTKSFTAFAVLYLVQQGKVDLDKPMGDYIQLPNPAWSPMPVRYYLGMITGIPDDSVSKGSYTVAVAKAAKKQVEFSPDGRALDPLGHVEHPTEHLVGLDFVPAGSRFDYSDVNYFLLGQLVAQKSPSGNFGTYTKNKILTPLGMNETGLIEFGHGDLWATPYNKKGEAVAPREPESGFSGGGFVSTMSDLEKFGSGLYNRAVLNSKSYEAMWTRTQLTSGKARGTSINFGLGWDAVILDEKGNLIRVSKNGGGWGWGSQLTFFPKSEYCVILLQNSESGNLPQEAIDIEQAITTK
jgi:CubicO group peptidase (beta-lactamase class C family)